MIRQGWGMGGGEGRVGRSGMRGRLSARSACGPGSCGVAPVLSNGGGAQAARSTPRFLEAGGPILVVGDDPPTQRSIRRALEGEGLVVEAVAGGWHALMLALLHRPSLVILAPGVPGLDWDDVLAGLQVAYGADVPIVVVSDDRRLLGRARRLWGSATVVTPFAPDDLLDGVSRALGAGRRDGRSGATPRT